MSDLYKKNTRSTLGQDDKHEVVKQDVKGSGEGKQIPNIAQDCRLQSSSLYDFKGTCCPRGVVHACNVNTREDEESKVGLGYIVKPCL